MHPSPRCFGCLHPSKFLYSNPNQIQTLLPPFLTLRLVASCSVGYLENFPRHTSLHVQLPSSLAGGLWATSSPVKLQRGAGLWAYSTSSEELFTAAADFPPSLLLDTPFPVPDPRQTPHSTCFGRSSHGDFFILILKSLQKLLGVAVRGVGVALERWGGTILGLFDLCIY